MRVTCSGCSQKFEVDDSHAGEHFRCPKCTAEITVQRRRDCPVCHRPLEPGKISEFEFALVDNCRKCGGAWFERGELNEVAKSQTWVDVEHHPYRKVIGDHLHPRCPACGDVELTALTPQGDFGLIVDRCESCGGFWLDKGEMPRLLALPQNVERESPSHGRESTTGAPLEQRPADWSRLRWMLYRFAHGRTKP